jgi:FemAB-related protein (PEP-CTERM system-associated)
MLGENETVFPPETLLPSIGFTGLDLWMFFTKKVYGLSIHRIISQSEAGIDGWLALAHVKHPIFGNYLATSPFGSYGGFAYATDNVRDALLKEAEKLTRRLGADHTNVRFRAEAENPPAGWVQDARYFTYLVDLSPDLDELMRSFSPDHRNHIRKSLKKGFLIQFGHMDLLDDVYETLATSMRELGSPYHGKPYLQTMAESLGGMLEFVVLYDTNGKLAGAAVYILCGDTVVNLHANILRAFRTAYAGEFLYWSAIQHYSAKGLKTFDLGRSLNASGNETFKMKWRPRKAPLAYWYYLPRGGPVPELNQKSAKFQLAIRVWKLLPSFVVRTLGPHLIRGIA